MISLSLSDLLFSALGASFLFNHVVSAGKIPTKQSGHTLYTSASGRACGHLATILPADATVTPDSKDYPAVSGDNWSGTARANPSCIVRPTNSTQVQQIVKYLTQPDVNVQFAIRSGGHDPNPTHANIDNGVLVDLVSLNEVTYDAATSTVEIGAGNRWGNVYKVLDEHNVTAVGGRVLDVGVGGFLLGSGLSYLTDLYGLGCDNVAEHEIVLADGSLVKASPNENPDLHWALKGGFNNFGIVTSFKIYTYPIKDVWGGVRGYSLEQLPQLYDAMAKYQNTPGKDLYANAMLQGFTTNATVGVVLTMIYLKPEANPAAFAPFNGITPVFDTTKLQTITELMAGTYVPDIPRINWFTQSFKPDAGLYQEINNLTTSSANLKPIQDLTAGSMAIGLQPISANAVQAGAKQGQGNALGLTNTDQSWFVLDVGWWNTQDDVTAHKATDKIRGAIHDAAVSRQKDVAYIFSNDASYDQNVIGSYGKANVAKMKIVQTKYDPTKVFQRLVPGGFKLGIL
ncbi:hypothetical protein QBC35DRAFT_120528 [Podospora australis]|uniref:FAD-binding PCMH-type domain-containing protein n=1 Tax=Podospora australis TaxID=1536484 RepID=A0AAN6WJG1_9PEZI|nr:hypothetical protein QBC35DRAFT_120528 [Podospora australis]